MKTWQLIAIILISNAFAVLVVWHLFKDSTMEVNPLDTSKTDSMQVFYSKQLDSMRVENQLLQVKIEAKTETIKTLKGLVKENNEKINPNNSVPILDSLRRAGFGKD